MSADEPSRTTRDDGTVEWRLPDGTLHRVDGPAVVHPDGIEIWYWHGDGHRDGGPAITAPDGYEVWLKHGERHRTDGPALHHSDGYEEWYLNGERIAEPSTLDLVAMALGEDGGPQ